MLPRIPTFHASKSQMIQGIPLIRPYYRSVTKCSPRTRERIQRSFSYLLKTPLNNISQETTTK